MYDSNSARLSYGRSRRSSASSAFWISGKLEKVSAMRTTKSDGTEKLCISVTPPISEQKVATNSKPLSDTDAQLFHAIEEEMMEKFPPRTDENDLACVCALPKTQV